MNKYQKEVVVIDDEALERDIAMSISDLVTKYADESGETPKNISARVYHVVKKYYGP